MSNITKKQHYVPQFYLKQFTDKNGLLQCYRKADGKHFPAHPNDVCFKEYGYEVESTIANQKFLLPNEIEKMFCSLEGEYSSVLRNIVNKCLQNSNGVALICTSKEKEVLASMVSNFISRNFLVVDSLADNRLTEDLLQNNPEIKEIDNLFRELKIGNTRPFLEMAQKKIFLSPSEDGVAKNMMDFLLKMNLSFLVTNTENFVTSDCPVGYNCTSDKLLMARIPLNTKVMAIYSLSDISRHFRNRARLIESKFIKKLNQDYLNWDVCQILISKSKKDIITLIK